MNPQKVEQLRDVNTDSACHFFDHGSARCYFRWQLSPLVSFQITQTSLVWAHSISLFCHHPADGQTNFYERAPFWLCLCISLRESNSQIYQISNPSLFFLGHSTCWYWVDKSFDQKKHGPRLRRRWLWHRPWCSGEQSLAWVMGRTEGSQGQVGCWWWGLLWNQKAGI